MHDTISLACGCLVIDNRIEYFCTYHLNTQPTINDPLDKFFTARDKGPDGKDTDSN